MLKGIGLLMVLFSLLACSEGQTQSSGDIQRGEALSTACAGCHGDGGRSLVELYPSLAGKDAEYLKEALIRYRSGVNSNPIMSPQASRLSDEDILDLAAYYSSTDF
jgi:cytochrome c553